VRYPLAGEWYVGYKGLPTMAERDFDRVKLHILRFVGMTKGESKP
jgi:hypothetical protein